MSDHETADPRPHVREYVPDSEPFKGPHVRTENLPPVVRPTTKEENAQ
jgi:hypothetical protein